MKIKYTSPEIIIETLAKTDVLCESDNNYTSSGSLNKAMGSTSIFDMIKDGSLWTDDQ